MCKPARIVSCHKPFIFSPVYKSCHAGNICISITVHCSVSCKPVSTFINSDPVKSFVTCKTGFFSNVSMAKEFNSVNYCLVTCTEHPVNVISSVERKSVVSYRTTCPVACPCPNYEYFEYVNQAYSDFFQKLMTVIDNVAPCKTKRVNKNTKNWFDGEVLKASY